MPLNCSKPGPEPPLSSVAELLALIAEAAEGLPGELAAPYWARVLLGACAQYPGLARAMAPQLPGRRSEAELALSIACWYAPRALRAVR